MKLWTNPGHPFVGRQSDYFDGYSHLATLGWCYLSLVKPSLGHRSANGTSSHATDFLSSSFIVIVFYTFFCCAVSMLFYVLQFALFWEQFPPEFETGDGADMRLPNHVFNQLKVHSKVDNKRGHRVHEKKEHATAVCESIVLMMKFAILWLEKMVKIWNYPFVLLYTS